LLDVPGEIVFFQVGHGLVAGFFEAGRFAADLEGGGAPAAPPGLTLSHNVASPAEVDAVAARAVAPAARRGKEPKDAAVGRCDGHCADPSGVVWEVCHNPGWSVADDGTVRLGPAE